MGYGGNRSNNMPLRSGPKRSKNNETQDPLSPLDELDSSSSTFAVPLVCMTCLYRSKECGVAVYDLMRKEISVAQVLDETDGLQAYQVLRMIKNQTRPDVIYISSKSSPGLHAVCSDDADTSSDNEGDSSCDRVRVRVERSSIFTFDQALKALALLHVDGQPSASSPREHLLQLNTRVDLTRTLQVCALGALVAILAKAGSSRAPAPRSENSSRAETQALPVTIHSLTQMFLKGCVFLDANTLRGLNVFVNEHHPSHMGIGVQKEGFSLFGMLNQCITPLGKRLLRKWLTRPISDITQLEERYDAVEVMMDRVEVTDSLRAALKKVQDVPHLLIRLQSELGSPQAKTFLQLMNSLAAMEMVKQIVVQAAEFRGRTPLGALRDNLTPVAPPGPSCHVPSTSRRGSLSWHHLATTQALLRSITEELSTCCSLIFQIIDVDQSMEGLLVHHGVCLELDELKDVYQTLPDHLTKVVEVELQRVPSSLAPSQRLQLWSIVYIPQVGYVLQVAGERLSQALLDYLPDYQVAFEGTDGDQHAVYYHTNRTKQLNQRYGDILYKIQDLEATICSELVSRLLQHSSAFYNASDAIAELDCLLALSWCARQYHYRRPTLTKDNVLHIVKGRHPLVEQVTETFISNDTTMNSASSRIHIVTGPNASGKSCYTRQVALIAYMAHIGSLVPADSCLIGLLDAIYVHTTARETVTQQQSAFARDLTRVAGILHSVGSRSLVVIDEFGQGTRTSDGVGLLAGLVHHYVSLPQPPKLLLCTHFNELDQEGILPRSPHLCFSTLEVMLSPTHDPATGAGGVDGGTHVFLYKVKPGFSHTSLGLLCAQMCGVPEEVVHRAHVVADHHARGELPPPVSHPLLERTHRQYYDILRRLSIMDINSGQALDLFLASLVKMFTEDQADQ